MTETLVAADVVAELTRVELASIVADVRAGRREHQLKSLDERGTGHLLVRNQYTGRYPFELLQNAADAAADTDHPGHVRFHLSDQALLVADNGIGFSPDAIRSICRLGRSTKSPTKSIGYKGLGFRSVGEITDRPQVITAAVRFGFDENRVFEQVAALTGGLPADQKLPTYAFPFTLSENDLGADVALVDQLLAGGYTTVMRLPLRTGVDRSHVEAQLRDNVEPQLMLFLGSLDRLEVSGTDRDFIAEVARQDTDGVQRVLMQVGDDLTEWLVYARQLPVARELVAPMDGWQEVETVTAAVALPLGEDGGPSTGALYSMHVYFPTEEKTGFSFITHADWALHLDRRQLSGTPDATPYNEFMTAAMVDLICTGVAPDLATRFGDPSVAAAVLAPRGAPTGAGAGLHEKLMAALPYVEFVATVNGSLVSPRAAHLLFPKCPDVRVLHALSDTSACPTLAAARVEADAAVRSALVTLGAGTLSLDATLALLRPPGTESAHAYYQHLVAWDAGLARSTYAKALSIIACVRTQDGRVVTPSSKVFFPRTNDDVAVELPLPIAVLPDNVAGLTDLLESAGVGRFDWRDIIPDYVVPILTDPGADRDNRRLALNALRAYVRTRRTSAGDREIRDVVRDVLVPARDAGGSARRLVPAAQVYFAGDWTANTRLEGIYGPFGQVEFLDVPAPDDPAQRDQERELWSFCGVADCPRVLTVEAENTREYLTYTIWQGHPHKSDSLWAQWWQDDDVKVAKVCRADHPQSQQLQISHRLDRFTELVAASDPGRLRLLWSALATHWTTVYEPAMKATFRCVHGNHTGDARTAPSLLQYALTTNAWVPARRGDAVELVMPWQAWRVAPSTPTHVRSRVPALPDAMTSGHAQKMMMVELGVADAARLSADDLFDLLRNLCDEAGQAEPDDSQVKAARWAMRTLNDVLHVGLHEAPTDPVPLLATLDGRYMFVTEPLVVRDPMVREAWGARRPVLAADEDCVSLMRVLSLVVLDERVKVTPIEVGHRPDLIEVMQAHVDRAAPWMLALLRKLRASAEETFVPRIKRLDVRPCNELILSYEFEGERIELAAAVSHIASRVVPGPRRGVGAAMFGTAYLEVDRATGHEPWFEFGPQLALHVRADNYGDQFGQILASDDATRARFLASKKITTDDVRAAAETLGRTHILLEDLVDPLVPDTDEGDEVPAPDDVPVGAPHAPDAVPAETEPGAPAGGAPAGGQSPPGPAAPPKPAGSGGGTAGGAGAVGGGSAPRNGSPAAATAEFPELDVDAFVVEDGDPGPAAAASGPGRGGGGGFGGGWTPEPAVSEADKRAIGRQGERAVYLYERRRVAALGLNPDDTVVWRSDREQYAPYDIQSVDDDGVSIFIEVKSTTGADPCAPFDISTAELTESIRYGDKFRVYRVTDVRSYAPRITRYTNPVALVRAGRATLDVSKARMRFGHESLGVSADGG
ncbi:sacsin N-terminal ATP-binding-like domain-containing protein [Cellulosimicrobium sp. NPDC057127]|uniref:sacsin N-terminal ATP-binding-like domain-containing protein n=1 Tax=Cellulosimicrobium sp. NPDC057127 TaxID=3346026 RepID=UPI00363206E6